jgi:four helix bundle protein
MSEKISSFLDLRVYQESFRLQQKIFQISKTFPVEEKYSLTDQIRRSSRSIGGNIAEAWQKRQYPAHFVNKLTDSDGEQAETQHWLHTAKECQYISSENYDELLHECLKIGRMLGKMINNPSPFIKKP